ncbi:MAG: hypothetical protein HKN72_10695 [Gemmatimonadetes bacterium]|nr:hypothetical protein [Gemmatimonadota bacterium]
MATPRSLRSTLRALRTAVAFAAALAAGPALASPAAGQLIPLRTVPVASGDQFRLLPSQTMGMGSVSYAVDDTIGDPWSQPAKGGRATTAFIGSPTFYLISEQRGAGRSFPVAGMFVGSEWFGGASLALQQIENTDGAQIFFTEPAIDICCFGCCGPSRTLSETFGRNLYVSAYLGRRVGESPWSVGLGVSAASLDAMDGVDLLYAGADRIDQSGTIGDVRLGAVRDTDGDRVSLLFAHNRVSMEHDVTFTDWRWDDSLQVPITERRVEANEDKTRTWAAQIGWDHDLETEGWRVGVSGAVNRKTHPKIPNYSIQNIPRDPGETWAYELGVGFSLTEEESTFALEVAVQPIWSTTWQEADTADVTASQGRLSEGDRSIENDFFFTNVMMRSGLSHTFENLTFQAGIEVRSYDYQLEQVNWVEQSVRDQDESWIEWSPTFGALLSLDALDLRYGLRVTTGTGRPGTATVFAASPESLASDVLLAPEGPLTLQDARVLTHQLSVTLPVR